LIIFDDQDFLDWVNVSSGTGPPGETSLDSNEARDDRVLRRQLHQLDLMQTICTSSLQTDNHANTSSLTFYVPDALPDAQPTVSKH